MHAVAARHIIPAIALRRSYQIVLSLSPKHTDRPTELS
jgi:hypothetical protein